LEGWTAAAIPCLGLYTILPSPIVYGIYCNNVGSEGTLYFAIVWAMTGRGGVPKQRVCVQRTVLILARKPRHKTISCIGYSVPKQVKGLTGADVCIYT